MCKINFTFNQNVCLSDLAGDSTTPIDICNLKKNISHINNSEISLTMMNTDQTMG